MMIKSFEKKDKKPGQKIIIYGAGRYGELALRGLEQIGLQADFFVDRKLAGGDYLGVKVISPEKLTGYTSDVILIATLNYFKEIKDYLEAIYARHCYDIYELLLTDIPNEMLSEYAQDEKANIERYKNVILESESSKFIIGHCEVVVTERCTLHCRDCANLMQYYQKPENLNIHRLIESFDRFLACVDMVLELRVLGGEPFICKDLDMLLNHYAETDKIKRININTNSTVIPNRRVIESLKNPKIVVHISNYGINEKQVIEFKTLLYNEKIKYYIHKYQDWMDIGHMEWKDYSEEQLVKVYQSCIMSKCHTFYREKFFICPRAAHGMQLGYFPEEINEYVDFSFNNIDKKEKQAELAALMDKRYIKACNYCLGSDIHRKSVPAAIQIEIGDNEKP